MAKGLSYFHVDSRMRDAEADLSLHLGYIHCTTLLVLSCPGSDSLQTLQMHLGPLTDCLPCLFHGFRNKHFNKILLDSMLYFHN